jgi:hypothetical protein
MKITQLFPVTGQAKQILNNMIEDLEKAQRDLAISESVNDEKGIKIYGATIDNLSRVISEYFYFNIDWEVL